MATAHVRIVGGGLAGSEAAWQCLKAGLQVTLYETRPKVQTPAHQTGDLAELVCSNSLKSLDYNTAPGQLKREMAALDSLIIKAADIAKVPAGQALAVDRAVFSEQVHSKLSAMPSFSLESRVVDGEFIAAHPDDIWILATGPLTSEALIPYLESLCDKGHGDRLFFYDAIAPVIEADSINMDKAYWASRYDKGDADYLNIPMDKDTYENFIDAIAGAEMMPLHEFEGVHYFESCLPIEVMAERGRETLRFGPLKPVGLKDPRTGKDPHAVIQLRKENKQATMLSMVGFQTKMKWPEQKRVFTSIPGLEDANFFRFGSVHRNTYINSPEVLGTDFSFKKASNTFLAGQITGVEGYTESAAIGLLVGRSVVARVMHETFCLPPETSFLGALGRYVTEGPLGDYQPMNVNFGLLPRLENRKLPKAKRKIAHCERANETFNAFLESLS